VPGDGALAGVDHLEPDVGQLAPQARCADDQDAADIRFVSEVERGRPGRADDPVGRHRSPHRLELGYVVGPVMHRVVRDVHHDVAACGSVGEDGGHAGHRFAATVDDAVEIHEQEHRREA
jgi:hypothetical protein